MSLPKILIIVGIVTMGALTAFLLIRSVSRPAELGSAGLSSTPPRVIGPAGLMPTNAFLPASTPDALPSTGFLVGPSSDKTKKPSEQQFQANIPSIKDVKSAVESALSKKPDRSELIELPVVSDAELTIDSGGVTSTADYLKYFSTNQTTGIKFDYGKFANVPKDENGILLLSYELVGRVLGNTNFADIRDGLNIQKEFLLAKINFLKSIKVDGETIGLNKKMIAFDKLTIALIDKTFNMSEGKISKDELQDFYNKYQTTATSNHEEFIKKSGLLGLKYKDNFFYKLANLLGLADIVFAQIPFGGPITVTIPCSCPPTGIAISVGPPIGGVYYLTTPFIASPLFFPFKAPHIGAFILGNFEPAPIPCNMFPFCAFVLPAVTMAGTSL